LFLDPFKLSRNIYRGEESVEEDVEELICVLVGYLECLA
jgi:hypothetical protein